MCETLVRARQIASEKFADGESEVADYKSIRCEWAAGEVRYPWCKENCKLLGAMVCPRSPQAFSNEWWRRELDNWDADGALPTEYWTAEMIKWGFKNAQGQLIDAKGNPYPDGMKPKEWWAHGGGWGANRG